MNQVLGSGGHRLGGLKEHGGDDGLICLAMRKRFFLNMFARERQSMSENRLKQVRLYAEMVTADASGWLTVNTKFRSVTP